MIAFGINAPAFGQQWFAEHVSLSSAADAPDYRPGGTFIHEFNPDGVVIYGTIGYSHKQLTPGNGIGQEGGHGKADIVIIKNESDGTQRWAFIFGTNNRDLVSQVIEDSDGNLVISGRTKVGENLKAFISKVQVNDLGGSYSFSVLWTQEYGDWMPTDLFEVFDGQLGKGYVVVGNEGPYANSGYDSYVFKMDHNGSTTSPGYWARTYQKTGGSNVKLFSGVQEKALPVQSSGPGGETEEFANELHYTYSNGKLFVCGGQSDHGYIVALSLTSGNLLYDKSYGPGAVNYGEIDIDCDNNQYGGVAFTEIIQDVEGELVCLGNGGGYYSLFKVDVGLNNPKWISAFGYAAATETADVAFDVVETHLGYSVLFVDSDNNHSGNFGFAHFAFDGTILSYDILAHPYSGIFPRPFNTVSLTPSGEMHEPLMDISIECGFNCHYTVLAWKSSTSTYFDDILHLKSSSIVNDPCFVNEFMGFSQEPSFCDEFTYYWPDDNIEFIQVVGTLNFTNLQEFGIHQRDLAETIVCEENVPCGDVCERTTQTIYICDDASPNGRTDLDVPTGIYNHISWSTGDIDEETITVDEPGNYYAYGIDGAGCVHAYEYIVILAPEINLQATVSQISCNGSLDGEICFNTDVNIVTAFLGYKLNGSITYNTVTLNSNSFCFTDMLESIHGGTIDGLEPGYHSITVYDDYGCSESFGVWIEDPDQLEIIPTFNCEDPAQCNGSIDINIQGGTAPYAINVTRTSPAGTWSNGTWYNQPLPLSVTGLCRYDNNNGGNGDVWTYKITVIDDNGCIETHQNEIDECGSHPFQAGVTETNESVVKVYPNPTKAIVFIESAATKKYIIYDTHGKEVANGLLVKGRTEINLTNLASGTYILHAGDDKIELIKSD